MTDTLHTPPPTAAAYHERPFTRDPRRWERERSRALLRGHVPGHTCSAACEPVFVHERTGWGRLAWTVPADGSPPEIPHQIGVLTPGATRMQRLALRWLTRRPAQRITLDTVPGSLRLSAAAVAFISLLAGLVAADHKIPIEVVLPALLLAEHLCPDQLDARAREYIRAVEGDGPCRYLQRLPALHTCLVQAAGNGRYALRRSAEVGHHLPWEAACLLRTQDGDTRTASSELIARERLLLQLAHQVPQFKECSVSEDGTADADQTRASRRPMGSYPPNVLPASPPRPALSTTLPKGGLCMSEFESSKAVRTPDVYLLFAHEPYYPGPAAQEINTTVVAAGSLLHPQVLQPDGARIHHLLTQGRRPGEIIPLATLTHELGGGADWPSVGDWERVTTDLVHLVRAGDCDALSLSLPEIARALVCTGPHCRVRAYDAAADAFLAYGPAERAAVLAEAGRFLACLVAEGDLWPGEGLLPPLARCT